MKKEYRIGFLLGSLNGAGAEKTILVIAKNLAFLNHKVDLLLLNETGDYSSPENVNVIKVEGSSYSEKELSIEAICNNISFDYFVSSRAEFHDSIRANKVFVSVHITPTAWISLPKWRFIKRWRRLNKLKLKFKGKNLIALSYGIKNDLVDNLGCKEEAITVINNPFELDYIKRKAADNVVLYDFDYIVYVSSFIKRKRHKDLIEALSLLDNKSIKLVLVGKGELEPYIRKLVELKGLTERVVFHGWDENPYSIIKNAKVSVLASSAEGLPRVLVESLVLGVPMVSTDCPSGPNEVLIGKLGDFLVPVENPIMLSTAIANALKNYPEIEAEIVNRFDAKLVADRYISLFEKKL